MEGLWIGVGGLIGATATAIIAVLKTVFDSRRVRRKDALDEVWDYAAKVVAHSERQDAVIIQGQAAVEALAQRESECREENAERAQCIHFLYDHMKRQHKVLQSHGIETGEMPEMPPMRDRQAHAGQDPQFLARQAAQSAELLQETGRVIRQPGGNSNAQKAP
jgi:hypothetical protein